MPKELLPDSPAKNLGKQGWHSIAKLALGVSTISLNHNAIRKGLQPRHLTRAQTPVLPMEGAGSWARLRLDCPRREVLGELKQEGPVAASPSKQWLSPTALGVPEIVLPFRYRWQQRGPFAAGLESCIYWLPKIVERIPSGSMTLQPLVSFASGWITVGWPRKGKRLAVSSADYE